jgi:hypothetical protein
VLCFGRTIYTPFTPDVRVPVVFMNSPSKRPAWFLLTQHWISLVGVALVATSLISWLFLLPQQIRGQVDNPYVGILVFLILPAILFTGLLLIPVGVPPALAAQSFPIEADREAEERERA